MRPGGKWVWLWCVRRVELLRQSSSRALHTYHCCPERHASLAKLVKNMAVPCVRHTPRSRCALITYRRRCKNFVTGVLPTNHMASAGVCGQS